METDIPLKRLALLRAADLLPLRGAPDATVVGVETLELPASAQRLDTLFHLRTPQGQDYWQLIEFQGYRDPALLWRTMGYLAWLGQHKPERPILATVIYLTPGDDVGAALQQAHALQPGWMFSLPVVRLWELDAAEALRSGNLALMVLSPLLGHASAALIEQAIHQVQNQAMPEQQAELLTILAVFTEPWIDPARLIELVGRERLMTSNLIQTLVEEQVAERVAERVATLTQERDTLRHALQQAVEDAIIGRFPTTPAILVRNPRHVTDVDHLLQVHQAIIEAPDQAAVERLLAEIPIG